MPAGRPHSRVENVGGGPGSVFSGGPSGGFGGGGGGRPDSATAGAKDPEKLGEAFAALPEIVKNLL